MAKSKHHEFTKYSENGREFAKIWNRQYKLKSGIVKKLAKKFDISTSTVYRIRTEMGLPDLEATPGRKKFEKRVLYWYHRGRSTLHLADMYDMCSQTINNVLRKHNVKLRPQHVVNPLHLKTSNTEMTHHQLLKAIKDKYVYKKQSCAEIAEEFGIDQTTVSNKLKGMGIEVLRQNHQPLKGGYKCQWCAEIMETVWQNKGPRKQKFCGGSCKNRAKDYRRYVRNTRNSPTRLESLKQELKENWGAEKFQACDRIMNVKPVIQKRNI